MSGADVVVVDYGSGNLRSMVNAVRRCLRDDQQVVLSGEATAVAGAERVILPGVGAFAECRRKLDESGLLPALTAVVESGRPFLGVCVGMQILADEGREFGGAPGLGWVPGLTRRLTPPAEGANAGKLPHVGWSPVETREDLELFEGVGSGTHFYFVHSYFLAAAEPADVVATACYGEPFTAAVLRGNLFGCQFHPEKSDRSGLRLLENFCRWTP